MPNDFSSIDPPKKIRGWELELNEPHRLVWTSPSEYFVRISLPKGTIEGEIPPVFLRDEEGQPSLHERREIHPGTGHAEEALEIVKKWFKNHPVDVDDDVRDLPGIGDRIADYLGIRLNITTVGGVRQELRNGDLKEIVQERFHVELGTELSQ